MKYAHYSSTFTDCEDLVFPPGSASESKIPWQGFDQWVRQLCTSRLYWQALATLKILGPLHPTEWGSKWYTTLISMLSSESGFRADVCKFAFVVSYSRYLSSKGDYEHGAQYALEASTMLLVIRAQDRIYMPRQELELKWANLAAAEPNLVTVTKLERWEEIAKLAKEHSEHGIESTSLTNYAQVAIGAKFYARMYDNQARLEEVERYLKEDIPSLLSNRCGLWVANTRDRWGQMLDWFKDFDKMYPVSEFLLEKPEADIDLMNWDIPLARYREENLKYIMFRGLDLLEKAEEAQRKSRQIFRHVPQQRLPELGLQESWLLEWQDFPSSSTVGPVDVLTRHIRLRFGGPELDDKIENQLKAIIGAQDAEALRRVEGGVRNIIPTTVHRNLYTVPFDQEAFESRIAAVQVWLLQDPSFDIEASRYLIARLLLQQSSHALETQQPPDSISRTKSQFADYIDSLPDGGAKQLLLQNAVQARQQVLDMSLFSPYLSLTTDNLLQLRQQYDMLLERYKTTPQLSGNLSMIGTINANIAETILRVSPCGPAELLESERFYDEAESYYDSLRSELSALGGALALEAKERLRQSLAGNQRFVSRAINLLTAKCLSTADNAETRTATGHMLWSMIQRSKARSLNDALSHFNAISKRDMDTIGADPQSLALYREWEGHAKELHQAKLSQEVNPSAVAMAREGLTKCEEKLKKNPKTANALVINKGQSVSPQDMEKCFAAVSSHGLLLVDWFVADVAPVARKLHMIVLRIKPKLEPPQVFSLELGIAHKVRAWLMRFLGESKKELGTPAAYPELQQLAGLVQPLAEASKPNDLLVFCPTTEWNTHRVPLHAIELRRLDNSTSAAEIKLSNNLLFLRNRIVYTYSHSLLRLSISSREQQPTLDTVDAWKAAVLSPLSARDDTNILQTPQMEQLAEDNGTFAEHIRDNMQAISTDIAATYIGNDRVTLTATLSNSESSSFILFLGHAHPSPPRAPPSTPDPLAAHLLLYHPSAGELCSPAGTHEPQTFISGETIVGHARLHEGAHVAIIACGSGVTEARVTDESLGIIPALFHAGARSATSTLWTIYSDDACFWATEMVKAWKNEESRLRRKEARAGGAGSRNGMIDLGACFQAAGKYLLGKKGRENLGAWAPYVWHGYWMFPRAPIVVDDSSEE